MAVDWNADGMLMWREKAIKEQEYYFDFFGAPMWREFEPSQYGNLKRQIGFALFDVPEEEPHANLNDGTGYTGKKLEEINKIFGTIKKCTKNNPNPNIFWVSFLFVSGKTKDAYITIPVIRIQHFDIDFKQNINLFIDSCGRVYKNWHDYLENNRMPECVVCYPRNGVYSAVSGAVEVEFGISPAGRTGAKVLRGLDIGGSVLNVGATVAVTAGMLVPVALPVVAGAVGVSMLTGVYAAGRNIQTLVDRGQHQESIGLDSAVSRNCWLGIAGGVMGIVSVANRALAAKNAQADETMSLAEEMAINSVVVSSCVLNGLAVGNGLANIIIKARNKEEITALDVFQFTSAVLFFTHSVISTCQAKSLINSMGKNSSGGSSDGTKALMNRISEFVEATKACNSIPGVIVECSPTALITAGMTVHSLFSVCIVVGGKLIEITKNLLSGLRSMCKYMLEVGELLRQFWESWNKEMTEVIDILCRAFGVKHWSELVIKGCRLTDSGNIRAMARTLIAEMRSLLLECGSTAMPSNQGRVISGNSAVVGTDDGPKSLVGGETQTYESYYDEIANIHAKFVGQQICRNPEEFFRYMSFVCKFVKVLFQKKKSHYEKTWEMVKNFTNAEDFNKQYGISGNPNNHFLKEVFSEFNSEEQDVFISLHLAYEKQNVGTSAQDEEIGQGYLDADGVRFYPFYSMHGLASNGRLSEQQYREIAAKLTGRRSDTDSIHLSATGDTAVIQMNAAADVIMVQCWLEDGKVSGIAVVLHTPSE